MMEIIAVIITIPIGVILGSLWMRAHWDHYYLNRKGGPWEPPKWSIWP